MKSSRIGQRLSLELFNQGIQQKTLADTTKLSQATITQIIASEKRRISPESLKAICHAFNHETNIRLLISHLQDEIDRSGYDGDNTLNIHESKKHNDSKRAKILAELTSLAMTNDNLYSILFELHQLIKI